MIAHGLCKKNPDFRMIENQTISWCDPKIFEKDFKIEQCTRIEQVQVHLCFCTRPISLLRFAPSPLKGFVRLPIWVWSLIVLILPNLSSVKAQLIEIVLILLNLSSGWPQLKCHKDLNSSSHCFSSRWSQSCPHGCSLVWGWCCRASHLCRTSLSYY